MSKISGRNILEKVFTFLIIFLIVQLIYNQFFAEKPTDYSTKTGIEFYTERKEYGQNDLVIATIENYSDQPIIIANNCPNNPLQVQQRVNGEWQNLSTTAQLDCENTSAIEIPAKSQHQINFKSWNHQLFGNLGEYKLLLPLEDKNLESNQFSVVPPSFFNWIGTALLYQPIYNALVFFASIIPGHSFGIAIILLTILIKTLLLIPTQKALKAQRKIQQLQPKILALQEKYKDDQTRLAQETMAIYKENKANPLGSCLPILIQLPILIALFTVIQNGLDLNNTYLLYGDLKNFDLRLIDTIFLGYWDLTKIDFIFLPIIVGLLQFVQIKLTKLGIKTPTQTKKTFASEMEMAQKTMLYIMPLMIAVFTASTPSGIGLYWATSTLYAIAQQFVINKQLDSDETKIKVVGGKANKDGKNGQDVKAADNKSKKEQYKQKNLERKQEKQQQNAEIIEAETTDSTDSDNDSNITIIKA